MTTTTTTTNYAILMTAVTVHKELVKVGQKAN